VGSWVATSVSRERTAVGGISISVRNGLAVGGGCDGADKDAADWQPEIRINPRRTAINNLTFFDIIPPSEFSKSKYKYIGYVHINTRPSVMVFPPLERDICEARYTSRDGANRWKKGQGLIWCNFKDFGGRIQ